MTQVGFESMIPEFERAKTVYALDRAATVIGNGATQFTVLTEKGWKQIKV
jgi:hypothetical protein